MTRITSLGTFMFVTTLATAAFAQVVPMVSRPIIVSEGVGQLSVDVGVGLNKGNPGGLVGLTSGLPGDRSPGLSVVYGLYRGIEGGMSVPYAHVDYFKDLVESYDLAMQGWPLRRDTRTKHHFGPVAIWGGFRLANWIAFELAMLIPVEQLRASRIAIRGSLPVRFEVIPGRLALRLRPDFLLGFGRSDENQGASVQISFFIDAGLVVNITRDVWADVGIGYGQMIQPDPKVVLQDWPGDVKPGARGYLPISATVGYSVTQNIDLFLGFTFANLTPGSGQGPADARSLTAGLNYRF